MPTNDTTISVKSTKLASTKSSQKVATKKKPVKKPVKQTQPKEKQEPADDILKLVGDLDPKTQTLLHRFSLRLQATIARKAINWLSIYGAAVTVVLIITSFMVSNSHNLVAVDENGRLWSVGTMDASDMKWTDGKVINFANQAVINTYDISYRNYERRLEETTNTFYTDNGKASLESVMGPVLTTIDQIKGTLYAEELGPGIIVARDPNTSWTVRKEYMVTLAPAQGEPISNRRKVTTIIYAVNDVENLKGLSVNQIVQGN